MVDNRAGKSMFNLYKDYLHSMKTQNWELKPQIPLLICLGT